MFIALCVFFIGVLCWAVYCLTLGLNTELIFIALCVFFIGVLCWAVYRLTSGLDTELMLIILCVFFIGALCLAMNSAFGSKMELKEQLESRLRITNLLIFENLLIMNTLDVTTLSELDELKNLDSITTQEKMAGAAYWGATLIGTRNAYLWEQRSEIASDLSWLVQNYHWYFESSQFIGFLVVACIVGVIFLGVGLMFEVVDKQY
jgi:hypothetical protein